MNQNSGDPLKISALHRKNITKYCTETDHNSCAENNADKRI